MDEMRNDGAGNDGTRYKEQISKKEKLLARKERTAK